MNTKVFKAFTQVIENIIKYFKWVVLFSAVLIALSGIYRVQSNEAAVVLRFGRLTGNTYEKQIKKPGLHFALPFFIDEIIKIPVQTMHEIDCFTHFGESRNWIYSDVETNAYLLTGDSNVVQIRAKVMYQIQNAVHYALYSGDAASVIDGVVSGELTRLVTHMDIDTVLTSGRAHLLTELTRNTQFILDELQTGAAIANIELTEIVPPLETIRVFERVRNAAINKETSINRAREAASTLLLNAQAEAGAVKQTAITEQNARLTKVYGEIAEFNGIYDQYVINPQIILAGNFRERVGRIIAQSGGSIIVPDGVESPVILLP